VDPHGYAQSRRLDWLAVIPDFLAVIGWPILDRLRLGPVAISPHGIGIALGYLAGSWWMLREGKKRGLSEEHIGTILLWALVGAIFGARFFYVLGHFSDFDSFTDMLAIWRGGISLIGGIAGAVIFAYPLMRRYGYRFLQVMDSAAIGLAFGIIIGRIGDLIIGDHLGKPTDFFLGWAYRGGDLPGPWNADFAGGWFANLSGGLTETLSRAGATLCEGSNGLCAGDPISQGAGIHQTALYDFFIAIGLFLFLRWMNRRPRREGVLIMTFAIWYGTGRVITDFLRVDKTYFGLTGSQLTSIAAIVISVVLLLRYARRPLRDQSEESAGTEPAEVRGSEGPSTSYSPPPEPGPTRSEKR
jgi:phosphatidylglycerol---prolipoprotein diacylglyceryl transferase